MSSRSRSFNKRANYWQPAALKPKISLTEDGSSHQNWDDKRKSGEEVFEMCLSPDSTRALKPMAHVTESECEKEISIEVKRSESGHVVVPMGKMKLGFIILALCLAVFLVALDQTIIATAVPKITSEFKAMDDVGW